MPTAISAADLDGQLARMQAALRRYTARRSPARRLPVELWDLVFELSIPSSPAEPSLVQAPLSVSQVCRRWRNIAISNPRLWAALSITTTRRHTEHGRALESLHRIVQLWLMRSASHPLSIVLAQSEPVKSASPLSLLLDAVLAHAVHLRTLDICGPEACLFPLESSELYLPVLEVLKIQCPWPQLAATHFILPINRTPFLRSLAVLQTSFDAAHIVGFDYKQLTELTLIPDVHASAYLFWTTDEVLAFLDEAPRLRKLRVAVNDFMPRRRTLAQATELLSLSVEFRDALADASPRPARIGAFFSLLYSPNLRHLSLRDRGTTHTDISPPSQHLNLWPQAQFLAFLGATPLRSLHLEHLPLYETQVIECLQQVPQLAELVLEASAHRGSQRNVGDTLLGALTRSHASTSEEPIASSLRSVEFRHCGKRCTEQALISMVDSRAGALEYLRVHRSAIPSPELVERVAHWNMVVDVHY